MAEKKKADPVLPGDLIQVTDAGPELRGSIGIVREVRRRGVGVNLPALNGREVVIRYERLNHGQFAVVGAAVLLPEDVQRARTDAIETARVVAAERAK